MNAKPTNAVTLDESKKTFVKNAVDSGFRNNPILINEIDRKLSMMSQSVANMSDPATYTAGPHGTVTMSREYGLSDTAGVTPLGGTVDFTEVRNSPGSYIFQCFTEVANVVDAWAPNGRNRLEVYRAVLDTVKKAVEDKNKIFNEKNVRVQATLSSTLTNARTLRQSIELQSSSLEAHIASAGLAPFNPALTAAKNELLEILDLNRDKLTGNAPVFGGFSVTTNADLATLKTELNNRFTLYRSLLSTAGYPADNGGTPAISTGLIELVNSNASGLNDSVNSFNDSLTDDLTDLSGSPYTGNINDQFARFNAQRRILDEYNNSLNAPVEEQLLSDEDRHAQIHIEPAAGGMGIAGQPFAFRNPILSPVPGTPTTPGPEMSLEEYENYYTWANKNQDKLTPDQKQALDVNASYFVRDRFETKMTNIHAHLTTLAGGATATAPMIINRAEQAIEDLIANTIPGATFAGPTETGLVLSALAFHYKLDTKNTPADLRTAVVEKLKAETIARYNLPSDTEQVEILAENKKNYAKIEASQSIWKSITRQKRRARNNYIGSQHTTLYNELKKYTKEDLRKPEVQTKIKADMIKGIMSARLKMVAEIQEAEKHTFATKLKANIAKVPGLSLAINAGLLGGAVALGAILNPAFFAPAVTATTSTAQTVWTGLNSLIAAQGGLGTAALKATGIGLSGALGYRLMNSLGKGLQNSSPWSSARSRAEDNILGSRDSMGNNFGGVGSINRTAATMSDVYDNRKVNTGMASSIRNAMEKGASFAEEDADKLTVIKDSEDQFKGRFNSLSYYWQREKQGMSAMIDKEIQTVLSSSSSNKSEDLISNTLNTFYGPNGTEERFLKSLEKSRSNSQVFKGFKFAMSATAAAGLGSMFAVTF